MKRWDKWKRERGNPATGPFEVEIKYIAPGEPPICCPDKRKNPTVNKPVFPSGTLECPPEEGGCGSKWRKEK